MAKHTIPPLAFRWADKLKPLIGRSITDVRYLGDDEIAQMGISHKAVVLTLDDGTLLWPMADDEGNDAGALFIQPGTKSKDLPTGAPRL